jgi:menaquinone-9 beta-reductase
MAISNSVDAQHFDVAVIGAGIAGSMSAILCSRAGLRTILLERHRFPRDKVCGCCINGRAFQILKRAGLESGLRQLQPATTSSLAIQYRGRRLNVAMPTGFAVSRRSMDQWLVEEAVKSGCEFWDEVTASVQPLSSEPDEREIQIRFTNPRDCRPDQAQHRSGIDDPSAETALRLVRPTTTSATNASLFAKVVLVCDGLGHPSLYLIPSFNADAQAGSRIGLGAAFPRTAADDWMKPGEVLMAVTPTGYAGVVEIENHQWNLAAAVDPTSLNRSNSPLDALANIFRSAGVPMPQQLANASIKGTIPLTRSARKTADHRLLLLGDSTGYVEPFTGEGMAWALTAAAAVIPTVVSAVRDGWSEEIVNQWQSTFKDIVGSQKKICRLLSATLRHPWLLPPLLTTCQFFPSLTQQLVSRINRVPEALDII